MPNTTAQPPKEEIAFVQELQKKFQTLWMFGTQESLPVLEAIVSLKEGKNRNDLAAAVYGLICGAFSLGYAHGVEDKTKKDSNDEKKFRV